MSWKFDLSVNFSLFNGAVVLEEKENFVKIGLLRIEDEKIKTKLRKSVRAYFGAKGKNFGNECCFFIPIDEERLKSEISLRYGESERENERENDASEAVMLLDTLLNRAAKAGATDIHIEERRVRFRISGLLQEVCELSVEKSRELVRRIKILSNLNVLETRRGQDGQFVFYGEEQVFVRVSCIPSISSAVASKSENGMRSESVVLRILNVSRVPLSTKELGFTDEQCGKLDKAIKSGQGLILICGSTGSGKSTTAASLLMEIQEKFGGEKKIITIEDPPEYVLDGVTQIHVDEENGMSFSDSLRFIFRQDPDVIFVGEIRDSLTARTVLQASLTGHLVLATVHTGGISETKIRMKELGCDFEEFSSVLKALIFQRLVCGNDGEIHLEAELVCEEVLSHRDSQAEPRNESTLSLSEKSLMMTLPLLTARDKTKEKRA